MNNIKYKIEFFSEWHCGSGLSAGSDLDSLVIKDDNNLPFIPGKTIKGLIREAAEDYQTFRNTGIEISQAFGEASNGNETLQGCMFFSNAILDIEESNAIVNADMQKFLYRSKSATAIEEDGTAKDHSLRKYQTTIPCTLYGTIYDVPEDLGKELPHILGLIKRLGINRNRGLGRCKFTILTSNEERR